MFINSLRIFLVGTNIIITIIITRPSLNNKSLLAFKNIFFKVIVCMQALFYPVIEVEQYALASG